MDISTLKIGNRIRLVAGYTATVTDLTHLPDCIGVSSGSGQNSRRPTIWWPADCVISCQEAEEDAKLARNTIPPAPRVRTFTIAPLPTVAPPSRFSAPAPVVETAEPVATTTAEVPAV